MDKYLLKIIACPVCKGGLKEAGKSLKCTSCGNKYAIDDGIPVLIPPATLKDMEEILTEWDKTWENTPMHNTKTIQDEPDIKSAFDHVYPLWKKYGSENFLEAGCGSGRMLYLMGKKGARVIGTDLSAAALKFTRKFMKKSGIKKAHFVRCDMRYMPFKDNSIGFIYGGGSIEHFEETRLAVNSLRSILKKGALISLTYPYISIATLTYRQLYGNISEFPVLKQLGKFFHITLMRKKFMRFGYEKSFFMSTMEKYFREAGFKEIHSNLFDTYLQIALFKSEKMKNLLRLVSKNRLFWPMVYTNGIK